jgi:hypothetical protein
MIPGGRKLSKLGAAYRFVGSTGTPGGPAECSQLTVASYGALGAGEIALKADREYVRCGDDMAPRTQLILIGFAPGEVQGCGEA